MQPLEPLWFMKPSLIKSTITVWFYTMSDRETMLNFVSANFDDQLNQHPL